MKVPDNNTFTLQDVFAAVAYHGSPAANLQSCFAVAQAQKFDPQYNHSGYAPANSMLRFRNYGTDNFSCGADVEFYGGTSYPSEFLIDLGTNTGVVTFTFTAYGVPDYFMVDFNGQNVIDLPFRGSPDYDIGGTERNSFKAALNGKSEPYGTYTYPNFTWHPQDGYPRVDSNSAGTRTFNKTSTARFALIKVYAPMPDTSWRVKLSCPA